MKTLWLLIGIMGLSLSLCGEVFDISKLESKVKSSSKYLLPMTKWGKPVGGIVLGILFENKYSVMHVETLNVSDSKFVFYHPKDFLRRVKIELRDKNGVIVRKNKKFRKSLEFNVEKMSALELSKKRDYRMVAVDVGEIDSFERIDLKEIFGILNGTYKLKLRVTYLQRYVPDDRTLAQKLKVRKLEFEVETEITIKNKEKPPI